MPSISIRRMWFHNFFIGTTFFSCQDLLRSFLPFNLPDTKDVIVLNGGAVTDQKAKYRQKLNLKNLWNCMVIFMFAPVSQILNFKRMQWPETEILGWSTENCLIYLWYRINWTYFLAAILNYWSRNNFRTEIGCVLITQRYLWKFEFQ